MKLSTLLFLGNTSNGLKVVAILKLLRGLVATVVGAALFSVYREGEAETFVDADNLMQDGRDSLVIFFLSFFQEISHQDLFWIAIVAFSIAFIRFCEAIGLWLGIVWVIWLALLTALFMIPVEIYQFSVAPSRLLALVIFAHSIVAGYLAATIYKRRQRLFGDGNK